MADAVSHFNESHFNERAGLVFCTTYADDGTNSARDGWILAGAPRLVCAASDLRKSTVPSNSNFIQANKPNERLASQCPH